MGNKKKDRDEWDLQWDLEAEDLTNTLVNHQSSPLLFGVVESKTVLEDLEETGALEAMRSRGYNDFRTDNSSHVQYGDRFLLYGKHQSDGKEYLLFDIRTRFAELDWSDSEVRVLYWDWLGFQDPKAEFTPDRPPLPGQEHPGLGVFRSSTKVMRKHVKETRAEAIVTVPEYFHNAWLYSKSFFFYEPKAEGTFRALSRDLMPSGLAHTSHAVAEGRVLDQEGNVFQWTPHMQVFPLNAKTEAHFATAEYVELVEGFQESCHFRLAN
jgi:hypothetical protein